MAEENNPANPETQSEQPQVQFLLERIYLKDLSFETPLGIEAFRKQINPAVNQELTTKTNKVDDHHFEVILNITVTVKNKESDEVVYLTEIQQAGLFLISGLQGQQLAHALNTHCANILFPYAREAIDSVIIRGSFPALMLPPINFDALFQQALAKAQAENAEQPATAH